jgi:nicotinic acid phosphoribosyltransferase
MKLVSANKLPVAKISEDPIKAQCPRSDAHLSYIKWLNQEGF